MGAHDVVLETVHKDVSPTTVTDQRTSLLLMVNVLMVLSLLSVFEFAAFRTFPGFPGVSWLPLQIQTECRQNLAYNLVSIPVN